MQEEGKIFTEQRFYKRDSKRSRAAYSPEDQTPANRWLLKLSLILLLISALVWGWIKLTHPETFPIHNIEIRGHYSHVDHHQLKQTILPFTQKGFLTIETNSLQEKLLQLSWIATASIQRVWPDKIIITLTEQQPIARAGKATLVNKDGELFNVKPTTIPPGLPLFIGPPAQQKAMIKAYQEMETLLVPLAHKITILAVNLQQFWRLQLDNGIVLLVGKTDSLPRLQRFVAVYPQVIGDKAAMIDYVDLRYNHGVAVHFKNQNSVTKS